MNSSLNAAFFTCKSTVENYIVGSTLAGCKCNLTIEKSSKNLTIFFLPCFLVIMPLIIMRVEDRK